MSACHVRCLEILKSFMGSIAHKGLERALDVAGGDGRVSADLLLEYYKEVNMFDQCPEGVKKAKVALQSNKNENILSGKEKAMVELLTKSEGDTCKSTKLHFKPVVAVHIVISQDISMHSAS